ncbi:hypothetical protein PV325_011134 [Microctonus aethiopoides]|nr:hypothetical protein PV325_011134 [Microctonus aethiopoides]
MFLHQDIKHKWIDAIKQSSRSAQLYIIYILMMFDSNGNFFWLGTWHVCRVCVHDDNVIRSSMNIRRMGPIDPLTTPAFEGIYEECTRMHTIIAIFNDSHLAKTFLML